MLDPLHTVWVIMILVNPSFSRSVHALVNVFSQRNCQWLIKAVVVDLMVTSTWIRVVVPELTCFEAQLHSGL